MTIREKLTGMRSSAPAAKQRHVMNRRNKPTAMITLLAPAAGRRSDPVPEKWSFLHRRGLFCFIPSFCLLILVTLQNLLVFDRRRGRTEMSCKNCTIWHRSVQPSSLGCRSVSWKSTDCRQGKGGNWQIPIEISTGKQRERNRESHPPPGIPSATLLDSIRTMCYNDDILLLWMEDCLLII